MRGRGPRSRRHHHGGWRVLARVERFAEPALLLLLRGLEEEGLVSSEWDASSPGPAKRRYAITPAGEQLLDHWVEALRRSQERTARFLERYEERR